MLHFPFFCLSSLSVQVLAYTEFTKFYHYSLDRLFGKGSFNLSPFTVQNQLQAQTTFQKKKKYAHFSIIILNGKISYFTSRWIFLTCTSNNVHLFFKLFTTVAM